MAFKSLNLVQQRGASTRQKPWAPGGGRRGGRGGGGCTAPRRGPRQGQPVDLGFAEVETDLHGRVYAHGLVAHVSPSSAPCEGPERARPCGNEGAAHRSPGTEPADGYLALGWGWGGNRRGARSIFCLKRKSTWVGTGSTWRNSRAKAGTMLYSPACHGDTHQCALTRRNNESVRHEGRETGLPRALRSRGAAPH